MPVINVDDFPVQITSRHLRKQLVNLHLVPLQPLWALASAHWISKIIPPRYQCRQLWAIPGDKAWQCPPTRLTPVPKLEGNHHLRSDDRSSGRQENDNPTCFFKRVVCSKLVVQLSHASAFVCAPRPSDMTQNTTHGGQNNIRLPSFSSQTQYRRSHSVTTSNCGHCRCWLHHVPPCINSLSQPHRQPGILHSGQQASNGMPQTDYFSGKCPQGDYICTVVVWFRSCICVLCDWCPTKNAPKKQWAMSGPKKH